MLAITLNPGFVMLLSALAVLAAPMALRAPTMAGAAFAAMWLLLNHQFGAGATVPQMGLAVVPFAMDELNEVFAIAFIAVTIMLAMYASGRRSRYEDSAIMLLAGAAVSALFAGDLVSLVAASSLAGLAGVWIVLASPLDGASAAGVRVLIWHGLEGLLLVAGVAFHLSSGAQNAVSSRLSIDTLGGGFIFAALMIRVGAPLAHVWLKDAVSHASSAGGAALTCFSSMLAVYALARLFPAEPLLVPVGAGMMVIGALFAAAEDDLRRAAAYGLTAQTGVTIALIGNGAPQAVSAAEAHAFTMILAFGLLQMALGAVLLRTGSARISGFTGLSQAMPFAPWFILAGGLAAAGLPGLASYASLSVALEASARWETRLLWSLITAVSAILFVTLALRPALAAHLPSAKPKQWREAPFAMGLACALAAFVNLAVGVAPSWLYRLLPTQLSFDPFSLDRVAPQLELLGAAGCAYLVMRTLKLAPGERAVTLVDIDAFYGGPVAGAGRWTGIVLQSAFGALQVLVARAADRAVGAFEAWARSCDRPYRVAWAGAVQLLVLAGSLALILLSKG